MAKANILGLPIPIYVGVALTNRCMSDCVYCYCEDENPPDLSTPEIKVLIDEIASTGCCVIWFLGGEPLLRKDIFEIAEYGKNKGLTMVMAPNGTLLSDENIGKIMGSGRISTVKPGSKGATASQMASADQRMVISSSSVRAACHGTSWRRTSRGTRP